MMSEHQGFAPINQGYEAVFRLNRLSLGLVVPIERYADSPVPSMRAHLERVGLAEKLKETVHAADVLAAVRQ